MEMEKLYEIFLKSRDVVTDSRKVKQGSIFFALRGETFDGNSFVPQALEQGAAVCVTDRADCSGEERCMVVGDVLATLQELARIHRSHLEIPVIGVTGTNGKTTTKELISAVLSKRYRTWATQGNFNNHLGVPLTLLSIPADAEIAVVEMGANHPGEIDFLCGIANPEYGLITNVGKAHLEGFGSFKGVVRAKTELYKHLAAMAGVIFVDSDNDVLVERAEKMAQLPCSPSVLQGIVPAFPGATPQDYGEGFKPRGVNMPMASVVTYGSAETAECKGAFVSADPYMKFYFEDGDNVYSVQTKLIGGYNYSNAMAAVCVGRYFGVELFDIKTALESYEPRNNRSQFKRTASNALILDCYNANPSSMAAAVENFVAMEATDKVVVLGSMKELGGDSRGEHEKVYKQVMQGGFRTVAFVGDEFRIAKDNPSAHWFPTVDEARKYFETNKLEGCTVLVKGSNSNKMWMLEEVL